MRLDHSDTQGILLYAGVGELARLRVLEVRDAKDLAVLGEANHAVPPENALNDALLEALLAHGELSCGELRTEVVAVDGAVLDDADEGLVVGPGHADEATAGAVPDGGGEEDAG